MFGLLLSKAISHRRDPPLPAQRSSRSLGHGDSSAIWRRRTGSATWATASFPLWVIIFGRLNSATTRLALPLVTPRMLPISSHVSRRSRRSTSFGTKSHRKLSRRAMRPRTAPVETWAIQRPRLPDSRPSVRRG